MHLFCLCVAVLLGRSDEARGRGDAENWRGKVERERFSADEVMRDGLSGRRSSLKEG
jgi:hypothetical protein